MEGFDHAYEDDLTDLKVSRYDEPITYRHGSLMPRFRTRNSDISCRCGNVQHCYQTGAVYP
jgi:hypothetical protein